MHKTLASMIAAAAFATAANAGFIDPASLQQSQDGFSTAVQQRILATGSTSSVGTVIPDYGDQSDAERFRMCPDSEVMMWAIAWQAAGNAPNHRMGYYTVANPTSSDITWVIGGSNSGLPSSQMVSVGGDFGLAFYSGDNGGVNSTVYFGEEALNAATSGRDHLAVIAILDGEGTRDQCGLFVSWEDNFRVDHDYNDFGMRLDGIVTVPTPAGLALLGLGAIRPSRRRGK